MAITTLKELKVEFPDKVKTSGNIYNVDGYGWFKQRNTVFGLETYCKNENDEWVRTSFNDLVNDMNRVYKVV